MYRDSYSVGSSARPLSVSSRQYEGGMAACVSRSCREAQLAEALRQAGYGTE